MDQGSNKNHSPAYNFTPTVTKVCVMWEGLSLPHDTKFGNCRCKIVDSRSFPSWSLIHGLRWSGLIKVGPGLVICMPVSGHQFHYKSDRQAVLFQCYQWSLCHVHSDLTCSDFTLHLLLLCMMQGISSTLWTHSHNTDNRQPTTPHCPVEPDFRIALVPACDFNDNELVQTTSTDAPLNLI